MKTRATRSTRLLVAGLPSRNLGAWTRGEVALCPSYRVRRPALRGVGPEAATLPGLGGPCPGGKPEGRVPSPGAKAMPKARDRRALIPGLLYRLDPNHPAGGDPGRSPLVATRDALRRAREKGFAKYSGSKKGAPASSRASSQSLQSAQSRPDSATQQIREQTAREFQRYFGRPPPVVGGGETSGDRGFETPSSRPGPEGPRGSGSRRPTESDISMGSSGAPARR